METVNFTTLIMVSSDGSFWIIVHAIRRYKHKINSSGKKWANSELGVVLGEEASEETNPKRLQSACCWNK